MIHIVADTTVYRADPKRGKAAFRALTRLAAGRHLTLHIPEIVRREFISQQQEQYSKHIKTLSALMHHLNRLLLPGLVDDFVQATTDRLTSMDSVLQTFCEEEFNDWASKVSAELHPIQESHGAKIVEAYFTGMPPFREAKRREDFPDAFLWQVICDLAEVYESLHIVSADKGIIDAARSLDGVISFESLEDFVASELVQDLLKQHFASTNFEALVASLPKHLTLVSSAIENELVNHLAGRTVVSEQIPEDNSEAVISMVGGPTNLDLDIDAVVDHGDGLLVMPVSLWTECLLDYAIFKADYYTLPDEQLKDIGISELNDHYFEAEENYILHVEVSLSIEVDAEALKSSDLSEDGLLEVLEQAAISIDSIGDIEVAE